MFPLDAPRPRRDARLRVTLVAALAMLGTLFFSPATAVAGGGCTLVASSPSSPTPSSAITAFAGEVVLFEGMFIGGADVEITITRDGFVVDMFTDTADADGSLELNIGFFGDMFGSWTVDAVVPDTSCVASATAEIIAFRVGVATFLCPESIQSEADLTAAGADACNPVLRPEDEITPPPGHSDNLEIAEFEWSFRESTGLGRTIAQAERGGGGFCDPASMTCTYGALPYEWFSAIGPATLDGTPPAGYRFGVAQWFGPDASAFSVDDPSVPRLSFDVIAGAKEEHTVHVYYFVQAPAAPPSPTATPSPSPAASQVPDTALSPSDDAAPGGLITVLVAISVVCAGGYLLACARSGVSTG